MVSIYHISIAGLNTKEKCLAEGLAYNKDLRHVKSHHHY